MTPSTADRIIRIGGRLLGWSEDRVLQARNAIAVKALRREASFFGFPLTDMTDAEVMAAVAEMARVFATFGVSCAEATRAFEKLNRST